MVLVLRTLSLLAETALLGVLANPTCLPLLRLHPGGGTATVIVWHQPGNEAHESQVTERTRGGTTRRLKRYAVDCLKRRNHLHVCFQKPLLLLSITDTEYVGFEGDIAETSHMPGSRWCTTTEVLKEYLWRRLSR